MSAAKHKCCESVFPQGGFTAYACGRIAAYEHEGKHYCKTHHPPTVKAKRDASNAAWRLKFQAEQDARKKADAERAEQKRRADCFPDLLEALQSIAECCDEDHAARDYASRQTEIRGIARAAIQKATQGEQG